MCPSGAKCIDGTCFKPKESAQEKKIEVPQPFEQSFDYRQSRKNCQNFIFLDQQTMERMIGQLSQEITKIQDQLTKFFTEFKSKNVRKIKKTKKTKRHGSKTPLNFNIHEI